MTDEERAKQWLVLRAPIVWRTAATSITPSEPHRDDVYSLAAKAKGA